VGQNGRPVQLVEAPAPQPQPGVQPGPLPTMISTMQAPGPDGRMLVVVQFQTPQGANVFFLDPDTARKVGAQLQRLGSAGELVLPQ
jgi:hypothetical protein